jgi:hypothetical protein
VPFDSDAVVRLQYAGHRWVGFDQLGPVRVAARPFALGDSSDLATESGRVDGRPIESECVDRVLAHDPVDMQIPCRLELPHGGIQCPGRTRRSRSARRRRRRAPAEPQPPLLRRRRSSMRARCVSSFHGFGGAAPSGEARGTQGRVRPAGHDELAGDGAAWAGAATYLPPAWLLKYSARAFWAASLAQLNPCSSSVLLDGQPMLPPISRWK